MKKDKRRKVFVDSKVQGALLCRVVLYWTFYTVAIALVASLPIVFTVRESAWALQTQRVLLAFGPSLIAALIMLPILVIDALRFSHSFAGPMRRLRTVTQQLAEGNWEGPIDFREGDYWHDLAQQINRVGEELESLRAEGTSPADSELAAVSAK